jgi:hypothetical protein
VTYRKELVLEVETVQGTDVSLSQFASPPQYTAFVQTLRTPVVKVSTLKTSWLNVS